MDGTIVFNPFQPTPAPIDEVPKTVTSTANAIASAVQLVATSTPCLGVRVRNPGYTKTGGTQQGHPIKVIISALPIASITSAMEADELAPGQAELFNVGDASHIWFTTADGANSQDIHCRIFLGKIQ